MDPAVSRRGALEGERKTVAGTIDFELLIDKSVSLEHERTRSKTEVGN